MNQRSSAFATVVSSHQVGRAAGHAVEVGHGAARVVAAVEERLVVVLATAEAALDRQPW